MMGYGPPGAPLMLVGEAYGEAEDMAKRPFVGASGQELDRMLNEAGLSRSACYVTNLVNARPPGNDLEAWIATTKKAVTTAHVPLRNKMVLPIVKKGYDSLQREISIVKPKVIVALGNWALWALTGEFGITKWRGSLLPLGEAIVIPVMHPAAVLRQWELRAIAVRDLRRVRTTLEEGYTPPNYNFTVQPGFETTLDVLQKLLSRLDTESLWIDFDIETAAGHITCAGISWSREEAICIPFTHFGLKSYWDEESEAATVFYLYKLLTHPNVKVRGQNLLYDCQYTWRWWGFIPRVVQDTMISHHTCFAGLPKSLAFQASIYCKHYRFWKEDHKSEGLKAGE